MKIREMQDEVVRIARENDFCLLAHSYQAREIVEIADFSGDSYALALAARKTDAQNVLMCGVRFMAETVKILSRDKRVFLSHRQAGCPMAEQMDRELIEGVRALEPDRAVICYINTTASLKTVCDMCVTSSSAVRIIEKMPEQKLLFIPDCNLGDYVARQLPHKDIKLLQGGCPIHATVTERDVLAAKALHPDSLLLVHPECDPKVVRRADYVGSTAGIMQYAKQSDHRDFIIGTELSIAEHLQYECPEKRFFPLSKNLICPNMKLTTLADVYDCVRFLGGEEIELPEDILLGAKKCIDRMVEMGES